MRKQHRIPYRENRQRTSRRLATLIVGRLGAVRLDNAYEIARHCSSLSVLLSNFILFDASSNPEVANRMLGPLLPSLDAGSCRYRRPVFISSDYADPKQG